MAYRIDTLRDKNRAILPVANNNYWRNTITRRRVIRTINVQVIQIDNASIMVSLVRKPGLPIVVRSISGTPTILRVGDDV